MQGVARHLSGAYAHVDRNSDGQVCPSDLRAFLEAHPDSLLDDETRAAAQDPQAGFASVQQARGGPGGEGGAGRA